MGKATGQIKTARFSNNKRLCDGKTEVYSRVCGFFRPVQQWNRGKREEFRQRKEFVVDNKPKGRA